MKKHMADMEESLREYRTEQAARLFDAIVPATDREWEAQLDQVAPVVPYEFTFNFDFRSIN